MLDAIRVAILPLQHGDAAHAAGFIKAQRGLALVAEEQAVDTVASEAKGPKGSAIMAVLLPL
jgi:hypothetical protein